MSGKNSPIISCYWTSAVAAGVAFVRARWSHIYQLQLALKTGRNSWRDFVGSSFGAGKRSFQREVPKRSLGTRLPTRYPGGDYRTTPGDGLVSALRISSVMS